MSSLTATYPFPKRALAALALPAAMLVTLGALAAIGPPPVVIAMSQKVRGAGVSITYAYLPKDGTLAIFPSDARGHMSTEPIGLVGLAAGDHRNIKVLLSPSPKSGTKLWAVLERAGGAQPFTRLDGEAAEQMFKTL
jgi:hypothetical protein